MDMLGKTMAVGVLKSYPVAIGSPTFDMDFNGDILGSGERCQRLSGDLCGECASGRFTELSIIITVAIINHCQPLLTNMMLGP